MSLVLGKWVEHQYTSYGQFPSGRTSEWVITVMVSRGELGDFKLIGSYFLIWESFGICCNLDALYTSAASIAHQIKNGCEIL